jgi:hypothetical protein
VLVNLEYKDKKTGKVTASSHGDLFSIWGATCVPDRPHPTGASRCIPSEYRCKGGGEWNHYRVEANDGVIKLAVNGKVVSGVSKCNPRKGYLALESEGAECRFKNLKIKELPSTNPKAEEIADVAKGFKALYVGDLRGWKKDKANVSWKPSDWRLETNGKGIVGDLGAWLLTDKNYRDFELIVDWRRADKVDEAVNVVSIRSDGKAEIDPSLLPRPKGQWNRTQFTMKAGRTSVTHNGTVLQMKLGIMPDPGPITLHTTVPMQYANIFIRELE